MICTAAGPSITCVAYHNTFIFDTQWSGTACSGGFNHYACPDGLNFLGRDNSYVTLGYGHYTFLAEVAQAHALLDANEQIGKVVLIVAPDLAHVIPG